MVWSLALRSDDAKQDPVVYGTKFGVVYSMKFYLFLGVFRFTENIIFVLKGRIRCTFRVFPKPFYSKKNLNAPRPSEHPPVRGKNVKSFI